MYSLKKTERLKSKKTIEKLFVQGNRFVNFPYKVFYLEEKNIKEPVQVAFAVPKKSFKKAVHRNLLKRRMREAYRLNKQSFIEAAKLKDRNFAIMILYIDKEILTFFEIEEKIKKVLDRLIAINDENY